MGNRKSNILGKEIQDACSVLCPHCLKTVEEKYSGLFKPENMSCKLHCGRCDKDYIVVSYPEIYHKPGMIVPVSGCNCKICAGACWAR
jgi:hypothetical protein